MERSIALRITMKGSDSAIAEVEQINAPLEKTGGLLDDIKTKSKAIDALGRKISKLQKQLDSLNKSFDKTSTSRNRQTPNRQSPDELTKQIRAARLEQTKLRQELTLLGQKGTPRYRELIQQVAKHKARQAEVNAELRKEQKIFEQIKFATGSYRAINAELVNLSNTYRELSEANRDSPLGQQQLQRITQLRGKLKNIDADMGIYVRNVGNYSSALSGLQTITQRFLALSGVALGAREIINANAEISDSIADVAKTSNESQSSIRDLSDELKFRDTRTNLVEQLEIGEIGGRLSIARDELAAFIESIDIAFVALGDQFNDSASEVTDNLAGLRNVLKNFKTDNAPRDILRIGNALNVLETQGVATAPVISDIVRRIGGISSTFGASEASIFGIATAINEAQISAELGSTAITKVLTEIAKVPDKFANVGISAGLVDSVDQFKELVENDIINALALVTKATAISSESNTEFAQTLDDLGIDGSRTTQVFAQLGNSYQTFVDRTETANQALQRTDSLVEEFTKKNTNFAAEFEKFGNNIKEIFSTSFISDGLRRFFSTLNDGINIIEGLSDPLGKVRFELAEQSRTVADLEKQLPPLLSRYEELEGQTDRTNEEQDELTTLIEEIARLTPGAVTAFDEYGRALGVSAEKSRELLVAERARLEFTNKEAIKAIEDEIKSLDILRQSKLASLNVGRVTTSTTGSGFGSSSRNLTADEIRQLQNEINQIQLEIDGATAELNRLRTGSVLGIQEEIAEASKEEINLRILTIEELKKLDTEAARQELERRRLLNEQLLKETEDALKKRLAAEQAAADNIRKLTIEALGKTFEAQKQVARLRAEDDISNLVGSPEQIKAQKELILLLLEETINDISAKQAQAQTQALNQLENFRSRIRSNSADGLVTNLSSELGNTTQEFNERQQELRLQRAQSLSSLQDSLSNNLITFEEYEAARERIQLSFREQRLNIQKEEAFEITALEAQLTEARLNLLKTNFENEILLLRQQAEQRKKAITDQVATGALTTDQAESATDDVDQQLKDDELQSEREFLQAKDDLNAEFAQKNLDRQIKLKEDTVALAQDRNESLIEIDQQYSQLSAQMLNRLASATGRFLAQQEEGFENFARSVLLIGLDALERTITTSIASAAAQSFAQPDSVATFGISGTARAAVLTALIRGAFTGVRAFIQSFEHGGLIPGTSSTGEGQAQGPSHSQGGINTTIAGQPINMEGREHVLRNGPETYIINKKSSGIFRQELRSLQGRPNIYSPSKRLTAEAINTFRGYGSSFQGTRRHMQTGGALSINPLTAPQIQTGGSTQLELAQLRELTLETQQLAIEVNARIDRLSVIIDPLEALEQGQAQQEKKVIRNL